MYNAGKKMIRLSEIFIAEDIGSFVAIMSKSGAIIKITERDFYEEDGKIINDKGQIVTEGVKKYKEWKIKFFEDLKKIQ